LAATSSGMGTTTLIGSGELLRLKASVIGFEWNRTSNASFRSVESVDTMVVIGVAGTGSGADAVRGAAGVSGFEDVSSAIKIGARHAGAGLGGGGV